MFEKDVYVKSKAWIDNPYLVQHDTGVKLCMACGNLKYSSDYPDVPEFQDGKLPVCSKCYTGKNEATVLAVTILLDDFLVTRECRQCGKSKPLHAYGYKAIHESGVKPSEGNILRSYCRDCAEANKVVWWEDRES